MPWKITTPDGREYAADKILLDPGTPVLETRSRREGGALLETREFTVEWVDDDA